MKKLVSIFVFIFLWSSVSIAETIVFNKCWEPIEKNAYGDKVKNFKEFKKLKNIDDFIVKINTDSNSIVIKNVIDRDGFDPFDPRLKTTEYKINYLTKDIAVGYRIKYAEGTYTKGINRNLNVTVDLNKHKLYFWTKKKPKEFYSKISCKLYKGTNSGSFLHKILKMLN